MSTEIFESRGSVGTTEGKQLEFVIRSPDKELNAAIVGALTGVCMLRAGMPDEAAEKACDKAQAACLAGLNQSRRRAPPGDPHAN